jgi:hypothetical protein
VSVGGEQTRQWCRHSWGAGRRLTINLLFAARVHHRHARLAVLVGLDLTIPPHKLRSVPLHPGPAREAGTQAQHRQHGHNGCTQGCCTVGEFLNTQKASKCLLASASSIPKLSHRTSLKSFFLSFAPPLFFANAVASSRTCTPPQPIVNPPRANGRTDGRAGGLGWAKLPPAPHMHTCHPCSRRRPTHRTFSTHRTFPARQPSRAGWCS